MKNEYEWLNYCCLVLKSWKRKVRGSCKSTPSLTDKGLTTKLATGCTEYSVLPVSDGATWISERNTLLVLPENQMSWWALLCPAPKADSTQRVGLLDVRCGACPLRVFPTTK